MPFTILLVEEEPGAAEPLADFLRARGCRVWTAMSARDALTMLQRGWVRPSLLLVSLLGPRSDLAEFIEACASEPLAALVPIILLSADPDLSVASSPAIAAVIPKPVALDRLLEIVHALSKGSSLPPVSAPARTPRNGESEEPTDPDA